MRKSKLLLSHLDIFSSKADSTKSLSDISSNVFVLSVLSSIISSLSELDQFVAKYIYGEDILPLFKSDSEEYAVEVEKIMTSQDFYNLYGFSKIPGSIFNSIFSSEEAMAKLLGLLEDREIMAQFSDNIKFLICHKEYLPEELSKKICEFEEAVDTAPVTAEPEIDPDMPALYEEPTPLLGDESEA